MFKSSESRNIVKKQHEDIVKAIEVHDASEASAAMRKHLEYTNDFISKSMKSVLKHTSQ